MAHKTLQNYYKTAFETEQQLVKSHINRRENMQKKLAVSLRNGNEQEAKEARRASKSALSCIKDGARDVQRLRHLIKATEGVRFPRESGEFEIVQTSKGAVRIGKNIFFEDMAKKIVAVAQITLPLEYLVFQGDGRVTSSKVSFTYLLKESKAVVINQLLLHHFKDRISWRRAFDPMNGEELYDFLRPYIGCYVMVDGHKNVLCACAYSNDGFGFVVSTSSPKQRNYDRWIYLERQSPIRVGGTVFAKVVTHERADVGSTKAMRYKAVIGVTGQDSKTFGKSPTSFTETGKRALARWSEKFIKRSWD